jgi:hypothetical protein
LEPATCGWTDPLPGRSILVSPWRGSCGSCIYARLRGRLETSHSSVTISCLGLGQDSRFCDVSMKHKSNHGAGTVTMGTSQLTPCPSVLCALVSPSRSAGMVGQISHGALAAPRGWRISDIGRDLGTRSIGYPPCRLLVDEYWDDPVPGKRPLSRRRPGGGMSRV